MNEELTPEQIASNKERRTAARKLAEFLERKFLSDHGKLRAYRYLALLLYSELGVSFDPAWFFAPDLFIKGSEEYPYEDYVNVTRYFFGKMTHRDDGPAIIAYREGLGGAYKHEEYYKFDKKHRDDDLPAVIIEMEAGTRFEWWRESVPWRANNMPVVTEPGKKPKYMRDSARKYGKDMCWE